MLQVRHETNLVEEEVITHQKHQAETQTRIRLVEKETLKMTFQK